MALGGKIADEVNNLGLKLNDFGKIYVDENYQTSNSKIFAVGDLVNKKRTVAWAAFSGRDAANKFL